MTFFDRIWASITRPSMTRVVIIGLVVSTSLFIAAVELYRELAVIPLAWVISFGMSAILYAIDRYGFAEIDTADILWNDSNLYRWWIIIYAGLIVTAHISAYVIMGS